MGLSGDDLESSKTVCTIHSAPLPHKASSSSVFSQQPVSKGSDFSAPIPSWDLCFKAEAFPLRPNTANHCGTRGNAIFDDHLRVCKHHLKRDTTHSSAPVPSFPQVRSLACPHGREARWPTSAATPWWSRALTCPRRTWLNSWGETAARQQTSAGLCGTGLHPGSTRCSESGLRGISEKSFNVNYCITLNWCWRLENSPSLSSSWTLRYRYSRPRPFLLWSAPCSLDMRDVFPDPSSPIKHLVQLLVAWQRHY